MRRKLEPRTTVVYATGTNELVVDLNVQTIQYSFSQTFNVSDSKAFKWCTDYSPNDMGLMEEENATRQVHRIAKDTIILIDTFLTEEKSFEKEPCLSLPTEINVDGYPLDRSEQVSTVSLRNHTQDSGTSIFKFTSCFSTARAKR